MKTILTAVLLVISLSLSAENIKCNNASLCVNSDYFNANITKISKRGEVVIVQIKYLSKSHNFDTDFKNGFVVLLDTNGNEFTIDGKKISSFSLRKGEERILSLKFRNNDKSKITEPFDLTVKGSNKHGEITFFDLKSK